MSDGGATAAPTAEELSRAAIAQVDPSDQLGDVLALPDDLRDALWRVESAIMQDWDTTAGLVVAGMGGSAIRCGPALDLGDRRGGLAHRALGGRVGPGGAGGLAGQGTGARAARHDPGDRR